MIDRAPVPRIVMLDADGIGARRARDLILSVAPSCDILLAETESDLGKYLASAAPDLLLVAVPSASDQALDVVAGVRSRHPRVAVAVATRCADPDFAAQMIRAGACECLVTADDPVCFRRALACALERANILRREAHSSRVDPAEVEQLVVRRTADLAAANDALHRAKDEAERADRAKTEFLSRMSHELRTPLTAILGFAQTLHSEGGSRAQREDADDILKAGRHLLALVDEVLDIARIENGKMRITLESVDAQEVLAETVHLIRGVADRRRVRIETAGGQVPPRPVMADRRRLGQVLLNLLSNAVKYNAAGGWVRTAIDARPDGSIRLTIQDGGPGIPAEQIPRVFLPFERLGAEATGIEGTGLGLAVAKGLVEAMGGTVGIESVPGRGTTFWVDLAPAAPDRDARNGSPEDVGDWPPPASVCRPGVRTVLYIEDDAANMRLIERILAARPTCRFLPAASGSLGIEVARRQRPDIVFLDLRLPDIPGADVLARLRSDPVTAGIPVVVVGTDVAPEHVRQLLAAGAVEYLPKPVNLARIVRLAEGEEEVGHR